MTASENIDVCARCDSAWEVPAYLATSRWVMTGCPHCVGEWKHTRRDVYEREVRPTLADLRRLRRLAAAEGSATE